MNQEINSFFIEKYPHEKEKMVLGEGNIQNPVIMLIGEAPGGQEVALGRPFVGKAGKNLDVFLKTLELKRENLYITNVVKFRPTKKGKKENWVNRTPTNKEMEDFTPFLIKEWEKIQPKIIVTLGNSPLFAITGKKNIGEVHGEAMEITINQKGALLFPLYHPAAVIYNRSLMETYEKDLQELKIFIEENNIDN